MISDRLPEIKPLLETSARAQESVAKGFRPRMLAEDAHTQRTPLLSPGEIEVDRDAFVRLLREIIAALRDWIGEDAADGGDASPALELDNAGVRQLLEACIKGGDALERRAEAVGLEAAGAATPELDEAALPFLEERRREAGKS